MKHLFLLIVYLFIVQVIWAQSKNFSYHFYGFVRGDLYYNTRESVAPVDGNFYLFPLDVKLDAAGNDLNKAATGNFYAYTSRLGLNVTGPKLGKAKTSANIEADFGGGGGLTATLRIRKAYLALDWNHHQLLVGQTWHPLFGSVMPEMLNLTTGAPYQPFNRSPQIRYQYKSGNIELTASALWQMQYTSRGPDGPSTKYIKRGCIPELYLGLNWRNAKGWLIGAGAHLLSISPRQESEWNGQYYKVNERMTTSSYEIHASYRKNKMFVRAKTLLASSLDHTALLGGYGVTRVNQANGKRDYTAFHHSTSWFNIIYGNKWKPSIFVGYTKNLGTSRSLVATEPVYGVGLNIDQLFTYQLGFSYNMKHWQFGIEGSVCSSWYGDIDSLKGKVKDTHTVHNYRILGLAMFYF